MSEFICPPDSFSDDLPVVFLAGHETGYHWQSDFAHKLLRSSFSMNIASPRRLDGTTPDTLTKIEDATWALRYMRAALGHTGVLALNLEPTDTTDDHIEEQLRLFGIDRALSSGDLHNGGNHIVIRVAPGYRGNEDYIGYLAGETGAVVTQQEAEFIAQILTRLRN